ncbi:hypothetical protein [Pedobacter cryoconitis]|uniref:hypothetical protein n=1 Tax=Pedobacter cryoconitis TaxID=188932 RepID=UPI001606FAE6|nr:hypothetical protein [Pedobacter cryoconitis]MBB5645749.1 hypothetical protein [Pedobacter cryoconitis]
MIYDFLNINLPYGIQKVGKDEWVIFNRKYLPLGSNNMAHNTEEWVGLSYNGLTDEFLNKIAVTILKDENGIAVKAFFYNEDSHPQQSNQHYNDYFDKLKLLGKLKLKS